MSPEGSATNLSDSLRPLQCYCTGFFPPGGHVDMSFCVVAQVALKGRQRLSQAAYTIIAQGFLSLSHRGDGKDARKRRVSDDREQRVVHYKRRIE